MDAACRQDHATGSNLQLVEQTGSFFASFYYRKFQIGQATSALLAIPECPPPGCPRFRMSPYRDLPKQNLRNISRARMASMQL